MRILNIRINSIGGDVYPGIAIFNAIRQCRSNVTIYIDGIAASIAGVIALCGKRSGDEPLCPHDVAQRQWRLLRQ